MKFLNQIKNIKGKTALMRVDFNVPIRNGKILDDFRIQKALPTIKFLQKKGTKIILISHLDKESGTTLKPVADYLQKYFKVDFCTNLSDIFSSCALPEVSSGTLGDKKSQKSSVYLFENLRLNKGEENNSPVFAKQLAKMGDFYVNEAFSVCHRKHASIVGVPKYLPSYAGFQLEAEIKNLKMAENPIHPFLFVLGGAKFETKIPLIKKFLKKADEVFVGGALMNNFFKEMGLEIGQSLFDDKNFNLKSIIKNQKLILPTDVLVKKGNNIYVKNSGAVATSEYIADIGPESTKMLISLIKKSKFVLMNGPMGNYENGFGQATEEILKALAKSKAKVVIGGGDTVDLISKLHLNDKFFFVSTGGGAMLEFLVKGTLPGIVALK